jgi:PAS domain S-box-containing protein
MNWYNPDNLSFFIQGIALLFFIASLAVFVFWVALPLHRLVGKLAAYVESRGDVLPGTFKNDADVLAYVFKFLTHDIQRKETELQGLYEQARMRARFMERYNDRLVESIPAAILGFDGSCRLASLNSSAETVFHIRSSEAMGKSPAELWASYPEILDGLKSAIRDGTVLQGREVKWILPTGETMNAEMSGSPLPEGEGAPGGYVVVLFDRTPLRRLETQARMNDQLASLVDLSTGLAHQIRNPLSGVLGYTDLILKKSNGEITELAQSVREDALLLKKVVDDFVEFLRERQAAIKPLLWSEVLEEVHRDLERELKAKSVALHLEIAEDDRAVELDRGSAYQAAFNLILNAIEASPEGGRVEVRCSVDRRLSEVDLIVEDSGPGVQEGLDEKVFHPFFTTKPEGRGLGLSVVQRVAQAARGRVEVGRSSLGGAKFTLAIPWVGARSSPVRSEPGHAGEVSQ